MLTEFWTWALAISLCVYLIVLLGIGFWASKAAGTSTEEYLLAGRALPLPLAVITLLATWFGAGVMLTVTDEVAAEGLQAAALDPLGVALCLVLAGAWLARPLWQMKIFTICDYYARRYGVWTEKLAAVILIPSYFGWVAVQFIAVANLLNWAFGLDLTLGIWITMVAGTVYTMLGGFRAVVMTDVFQLSLVLIGVVWLGAATIAQVGWTDSQAAVTKAVSQPTDWKTLVMVLELLVIGSLGNLPAQDLVQRFLCVRTARAAQWSCYLAGAGYLLFGIFPILLGLLATHVLETPDERIVMNIAGHLMSGPVLVVFILAVISAVLSTIDGAILSPASVMAQNLVPETWRQYWGPVVVNRFSVGLVAGLSLLTAMSGQEAYDLLQEAYSLMLVGLLVPLLGGIWLPRKCQAAALSSMAVGTLLWLGHFLWEPSDWFFGTWLSPLGIFLPMNITVTGLAALIFVVFPNHASDHQADASLTSLPDPTRAPGPGLEEGVMSVAGTKQERTGPHREGSVVVEDWAG